MKKKKKCMAILKKGYACLDQQDKLTLVALKKIDKFRLDGSLS